MLTPILALIALASPAQGQSASWQGVWRNAANSVHIRTQPCGRNLCGTVIWANEKAKADVAARGGRLVGTQLFRDFERGEDGLWYGEVFVPDIGRSFSGTIEQVDANTLVGEGCLFGRLGCRTQVWKRVAEPARARPRRR
jgi:uncharacterized protein (DUF2147 family)